MPDTVDAPHLTFVFLATVAGLTAALIWMFCKLEQSERAQRVRRSVAARVGFGRGR